MLRTTIAFAAALLITTAAFGQDAEFGRSSGGQIETTMKRPNMLSGSLGVSFSRSALPFANFGNGRGYEGTVGGTILKDRLWFFGSGQFNQATQFAPAAGTVPRIMLGNMTAHLNDRQTLTSSFDRGSFATLPSSFLSLHYTGIVSSSMSFSASVYQHSSKAQLIP
jgi:hypothetical protein